MSGDFTTFKNASPISNYHKDMYKCMACIMGARDSNVQAITHVYGATVRCLLSFISHGCTVSVDCQLQL